MSSKARINPKPLRDTYKARRALQIAVQAAPKWPLYVPKSEAVRLTAADEINISMFRVALRVARSGRQDLIDKVLSNSISLHHAEEIIFKGERVVCPHCNGSGHIFNKDSKRNDSGDR